MAIQLPHIEDSKLTFYIPPKGEYETFNDEGHYIEKLKEWGLSSKKEFWFKGPTYQRLVRIKGYETYGVTGEHNTLVIEFQDGNLLCIQPAYLKEMQSSNFGKEIKAQDSTEPIESESIETIEASISTEIEDTPSKETKPIKEKKEKQTKIVLPEDKVRFTGIVKQFSLSWNHFNEENDEVVVLDHVRIEQDEVLDVGLAWCAHSKTLKKLELIPGESLQFEGKIVKKTLPKGKDIEDEAFRLDVTVAYKINNPSKIIKVDGAN